MTIWLLALVLLVALAGIGYRQGAIRVAFSLVGILLAVLLAARLGKLIKPALLAVGLKNPVLLWVVAPLVIFVLISILCKVGGLAVHQKVDVHFRYHAGDLRQSLWERLYHRVGLCLGLANGALYFLLIAWLIYAFSYWTAQMATADNDPKTLQILNRLGQDLQSSGFNKAAKAIDPLPQTFYDAADVAGLIYNNSLLEARLARYPAFLGLAQRAEFQGIATDKDFTELRQRQDSLMNVLHHSRIQAIVNNPELLTNIWGTVVPDLGDLRTFLETGKSPKYDPEKILGRWNFDINGAMAMMRRAKPNIAASEMQRVKQWLVAAFAKTSLVAMTDHQVTLKNLPQLKPPARNAPASYGPQTLQGQWNKTGESYLLAFSGGQGDLLARIENDRLMIKAGAIELVFNRED